VVEPRAQLARRHPTRTGSPWGARDGPPNAPRAPRPGKAGPLRECPSPRRCTMTLKILDPTVAALPIESPLAKRESGLDGKVLGLLDNTKVNGDRLLALVREELGARYDIREVVVMRKAGASATAEASMLDNLAARCDVVVTAIGD